MSLFMTVCDTRMKVPFLKEQSGALISCCLQVNFSWLVYCTVMPTACSEREKKIQRLFVNIRFFSWSYSDRIILDCDPFYLINAENHLAHKHFTLAPKYRCRGNSLNTLHIQKCFGEGILGLHLPARLCLREVIVIQWSFSGSVAWRVG